MTSFVIRSETPQDTVAIAVLTKAAFLDAPHTDHTEAHIIAALREAGALTLSLVAEMDETIVGHVGAGSSS